VAIATSPAHLPGLARCRSFKGEVSLSLMDAVHSWLTGSGHRPRFLQVGKFAAHASRRERVATEPAGAAGIAKRPITHGASGAMSIMGILEGQRRIDDRSYRHGRIGIPDGYSAMPSRSDGVILGQIGAEFRPVYIPVNSPERPEGSLRRSSTIFSDEPKISRRLSRLKTTPLISYSGGLRGVSPASYGIREHGAHARKDRGSVTFSCPR
jgi:hypothetical protein